MALKKKVGEVKAAILNCKKQQKLSKHIKKLKTRKVSDKATEARKNLISKKFVDRFNSEVKKLREVGVEINLNLKTDAGSPNLIQRIGEKRQLSDILSEGEQKTIALAEFLAELSLDSSASVVVFDDPVTSLDHHIIHEVGKRVLDLATERQVILFTHSILLFNSIREHKSRRKRFKKLDYKTYETQTNLEHAGVLLDDSEITENSVRGLIGRIKRECLNISEDVKKANNDKLASNGFGILRSAIEHVVQDELLQGTVRRYSREVRVTLLDKIDGQLFDGFKEELMEIHDQCCEVIEAHSKANIDGDAMNPAVTGASLTDLKNRLDALEDIRKRINKSAQGSKPTGSTQH